MNEYRIYLPMPGELETTKDVIRCPMHIILAGLSSKWTCVDAGQHMGTAHRCLMDSLKSFYAYREHRPAIHKRRYLEYFTVPLKSNTEDTQSKSYHLQLFHPTLMEIFEFVIMRICHGSSQDQHSAGSFAHSRLPLHTIHPNPSTDIASFWAMINFTSST